MINKLQEAINKAHKIVFFTGAGMSTDSGIPDFISNTGLYKNNKHAEEIISHSYFMQDPKTFYEFYKDKMVYENAKPNYGHEFIAKLQDTKDVTVVTQNIDGLHIIAGNKKVYELHGSIFRNHCMKCNKFYTLSDILKQDGVLGTSLNVYPAAGLVRYFRGDTLAIINKEPTKSDECCDIVIHDSISDTFKKIHL